MGVDADPSLLGVVGGNEDCQEPSLLAATGGCEFVVAHDPAESVEACEASPLLEGG